MRKATEEGVYDCKKGKGVKGMLLPSEMAHQRRYNAGKRSDICVVVVDVLRRRLEKTKTKKENKKNKHKKKRKEKKSHRQHHYYTGATGGRKRVVTEPATALA